MHAAQQFDKTEKLSLTKVVKLLTEAGDTVFTINFRKKIDEKKVQEKLGALDLASIQADKKKLQ